MNEGEHQTVTIPNNQPADHPGHQPNDTAKPNDTARPTFINLPAKDFEALQQPNDQSDAAIKPSAVDPDAVDFRKVDHTAADLNDDTVIGLKSDTTPTPVANAAIVRQIGRYQTLRELGRGGMGVVYEAIDPQSHTTVAIKMLTEIAAGDPSARLRFEKEARLLAEVNNPWVTNLLDVGEHQDVPYIVIEFVDGTDLSRKLKSGTRFTEKQALNLIADIARALVPAHDLGIIHRDIKPGNILLSKFDSEPTNREERSLASRTSDEIEFRVRLADFGLARHRDQSQSMQMTQTGAFMGTPVYMSPEQCKGTGEITPETDVYALGVTLFEILAGEPPFTADDPMQLAAKHCFDSVPDLTKRNSAVSDTTQHIVNKALAKEPTSRYANAGELLADIQQLLTGEANVIAQHPTLPKNTDAVQHVKFTWELNSPPEQLWPYVSDTERINEALGLPAVEFEEQQTSTGLQRTGRFQLAGMTIEWEEHPFEWIEGRRFGVFREFSKGPFRWFSSAVNMECTASGGTRMAHTIQICPRNLMGRLVAALEIKVKAKKSLDRVYRRIDKIISEKAGRSHQDPFATAKPLSKQQKSRLTQRLQELEQDNVSIEIIDNLKQLLTEAPQQVVSRIRPLEFCRTHRLDPQQTVNCLLHAAARQILQIQWDILCPTCRVSSDSAATMKALKDHAYCEACDADFEVDFASVIELIFRAHPEIRDTSSATYCIGGPGHSPHVVAQVTLQPGERFELQTQLDAGEYILRGPRLPFTILLHVDRQRGVPRAEIHFRISSTSPRLPLVHSGNQTLTLVNHESFPLQIRLERTIPRTDVMTAAQAISTPAFAELFPNEVPDPQRAFTTASFTVCLLHFSTLHELTEKLGDLKGCELWAEIQKRIRQHIAVASGILVRSSTAEILIAFQTIDSALTCLKSIIDDFDLQPTGPPSATINRGSVVATNTNGLLDYFGRTIDEARSLLPETKPGNLSLPPNKLQQDAAIQSLFNFEPTPLSTQPLQPMQISLAKSASKNDPR